MTDSSHPRHGPGAAARGRAGRVARALIAAAAAALIAAAAMPAAAGAAADRLFVEGVLDAVPDGSTLVYSHVRSGDDSSGRLLPIVDGEIRVTLRAAPSAQGAGREALVRMTADGRTRELHPFPAGAGNPLLMTFLESSLRSMARITGGSPHYIRNRMKEALRRGGEATPATARVGDAEVAAERVVLRPFAADPNRDRMGPFGDLELRFVVSDAVPGAFLRFEAVSGPGPDGAPAYREDIAFAGVRDGT